jgi:hypothetical protein
MTSATCHLASSPEDGSGVRIDHLKSTYLAVARRIHGTRWLHKYPTNLVVHRRRIGKINASKDLHEIRTEIKEQELLMDQLYDDRLHRLISEDFFRQRWDQLEEKRRQLSGDLARHQHAEGAYMELGSKLIELIAAGSPNIRAGRSGATARVSRLADIEPRPEGQNVGI